MEERKLKRESGREETGEEKERNRERDFLLICFGV